MALEVTGGVIRDGSGNEETLADLSDGRAKAYIQGTTLALNGSFNISSFIDDGVGDFKFSFVNDMANGSYAVTTAGFSTSDTTVTSNSTLTNEFELAVFAQSGSATDRAYFAAIHGTLA